MVACVFCVYVCVRSDKVNTLNELLCCSVHWTCVCGVGWGVCACMRAYVCASITVKARGVVVWFHLTWFWVQAGSLRWCS